MQAKKEKLNGLNVLFTNQDFITSGFIALEKMLSKYSGQFCIGNQITMADAFLVPQVYNAVRWGVDMSQFPLIDGIDKRLALHDAFIASHPDQQPDAK